MNLVEALSQAASHADPERMRYYGIVAGTVTDASDSASLGRVKARLRGMEDNSETGWLVPLWPGGIEAAPLKDDPVMVLFEDGDENRGCYLCFAGSKTKNRPNENMVLGLTFAGMYNDLVTQFNQLRSDMANHVHPSGTLLDGLGNVCTGATALKATTATAAGKMQKADGASVSAAAGDKKALSGRVKVGI